MNDDKKDNGLTLVTGDKEPAKFATQEMSNQAEKLCDELVSKVNEMGFAANVILVSNDEFEKKDNGVLTINIGHMADATDRACDGMLHSLFTSIGQLVDLTPELKRQLDVVYRNIRRSLDKG